MKPDPDKDRSLQPAEEAGRNWVRPKVRRMATSAADHMLNHTADGFVEGFS
jgi:hypothetical protein